MLREQKWSNSSFRFIKIPPLSIFGEEKERERERLEAPPPIIIIIIIIEMKLRMDLTLYELNEFLAYDIAFSRSLLHAHTPWIRLLFIMLTIPTSRSANQNTKIFINLSKIFSILTCHAYYLSCIIRSVWEREGADHITVSSTQQKYTRCNNSYIFISVILLLTCVRMQLKYKLKLLFNKVLNTDQSILIKIGKICFNSKWKKTTKKKETHNRHGGWEREIEPVQ